MNLLASDTADADARTPANAAWLWVFGAWLLATLCALAVMNDYGSHAGDAARAPATWPSASLLPRAEHEATLVMVAHTRCACTRASLHELERILARAGDDMHAIVVFVGPHDDVRSRTLLDVRAIARAIPGVRVFEDEDEARLFGAATSGQVLLYDEAGALVFRGGITPSRGHEGASAGGDAVRRFLAARDAADKRAASSAPPPGLDGREPQTSDVFGCALFDARTR